MFKQFSNLYFAPVDAPAASSGSPAMGKEDIIDFLGKDDEKEVIDIDEKVVEKKADEKEAEVEEPEEKKSELEELEEELDEPEEPTEEQLELASPASRKDILKKFPTLFKEFPYLEKAYYREQQYTELLPTISDAKVAVEKATTLDNIEQDLMKGDTEKLLLAAKNEPKAFNKLIDNYMDVLSKVDQKAYTHVVGNTIKHVIVAMVRESRTSNNDVLRNAAQILNQFVFASSEYTPPVKLAGEEEKVNPKENELAERERSFNKQQFDVANGDLSDRVNKAFKTTIESKIDPLNSMTDYNRKNAIRDAMETLENGINGDTRFRLLVDKLWERAAKDNYSKSSMDKIKSAFYSKAQTLLPSVIKKARNEALRGMGKRVMNEDRDDQEEKNPKRVPADKSMTHSNGSKNRSTVPSGMSSIDFLMADD